MAEHSTVPQNGSPGSKLVEVKDLVVHFHLIDGVVPAVRGVNFAINRGQTLGVVGESGCGKTVTALSILRLAPSRQARIVGGQILFHRPDGHVVDLIGVPPNGAQMRSIRGGEIAVVFQEPMTSLTPAYTIGEQIIEAVTLHQGVGRGEARQRAIEMLERVGMPQPSRVVDSYPHQLSGGMLQRAMIAVALSCNPSLLIADEPTTALDVTTAAQILELMQRLQEELGMAMMYISHNLGVIAELADDVVVMYLGKVVEHADVETVFTTPKHPYTQGLLNSIPRFGSRKRLEPIHGTVPELRAIPDGCSFASRCPHFMSGICDGVEPPLILVGPRHEVRCYLYDPRE